MADGQENQVGAFQMPQFPSLFGSKEQKRLEELQSQKKQMEEIYQAKFTPEAWSKVSVPEKAVRTFLPGTFFEPIVKTLTPWRMGFDWGVTPTEAQTKLVQVEGEVKELARKQQVTSVLPLIQETLRSLALSNETLVTDAPQLNQYFRLGELGFNDQDIAYIMQYAQNLTKATPEQLVTGEGLGLPPISEADIEELARQPQLIDPRFILSTVAFSKNLEQIQQALRDAYPPQTADFNVDTRRDAIIKAYKDKLTSSGVKVEEGKPLTQSSKEAFDKLAEEVGSPVTITNPDTGTVIVGSNKGGNIYVGDILVGTVDKDMNFTSVNLYTGEPATEENQINWFNKYVWNNLYSGGRSFIKEGIPTAFDITRFELTKVGGFEVPLGGIPMPTDEEWHDSSVILKKLSALPTLPMLKDQYKSLLKKKERGELADEEIISKMKARIIGINQACQESAQFLAENTTRRALEYQAWIKEHPEMAPKPEYANSPVSNTKLLRDPGYYCYLIFNQLPLYAGAYAVGVAATVVSRNPMLGAMTAATIMTPLEINGIYQDLLNEGADPATAAELAITFGSISGSLEVLPGLIFLKVANPAIMKMFKRSVQKEAVKFAVRNLAERGVWGKVSTDTLKVYVSEVVEEGLQQITQNAAAVTFGSNRSLIEDVPETLVQSAIAMIPMIGAGGLSSYAGIKANMPAKFQEKMTETEDRLMELGYEDEYAKAVALSEILETEEGQAAVEVARQVVEEEVPVTKPEVVDKVANLEKSLAAIHDDIRVFNDSIKKQEERLSKIRSPYEAEEQQVTIEGMRDQLAELQRQRENKMRSLRRARKAAEQPPQRVKAVEGGLAKPEVATTFEAQLQHKLTEELGMTPKPPPKVMETGKPFEASVWRGIKGEGEAPTDEGLAGKGTYYSTDKDNASTYGKIVEQALVKLEKPFVIKNQADWLEFAGRTMELRQHAATEGKTEDWVQDTLRQQLELEGYDGVVIASGIVEKGTQVVVFHPDKAVTTVPRESPVVPPPEVTPIEEIVPEEPGDLVPLTRKEHNEMLIKEAWGSDYEPTATLPKMMTWEEEQALTRKALTDNPEFNKFIWESQKVKTLRAAAKNVVDKLRQEYARASQALEKATPETQKEIESHVKEIENSIKKIGKDAKIGKVLLTKGWDELIPAEQEALTVSAIPNKSLKFNALYEVLDMKHYMRGLQEYTGLPFHDIFMRLRQGQGLAHSSSLEVIKRIGYDPHLNTIRGNPDIIARVSQEIAARAYDAHVFKAAKVEHPEHFTLPEHYLADVVEGIYKSYQPKVRYLRVIRTNSTFDSFKAEFPDAPELELKVALDLKDKADYQGLWQFMNSVEWGVIREGYDPKMLHTPNLFPQEARLDNTRGEARLMPREATGYQEELMERNLLQRLVVYVRQIETQWALREDIENLGNLWDKAADKFVNAGHVENVLKQFMRELQGIPQHQSLFDTAVRRLWRQAMSTVFQHLWMPFRNIFQHIAFFPDRTELARVFIQKMPADTNAKAGIFYDNFVQQLEALRTDWLYTGEKGLPGLTWAARLADRLSLYPYSDSIPRRWSFLAAMNKAQRATIQFLADGDIAKWVKQSGAQHLSKTEQAYALKLLAMRGDNFNLGIKGLERLSGAEMASIYLAQEITDQVNFIYDRSYRAPVEMGATGRTIFNLIVFPRSYAQRIFLAFQQCFDEGIKWDAKTRDSFKQVILLIAVGEIVSQMLCLLSNKRQKAYSPLGILQWSPGGLMIGAMIDVANVLATLFNVLTAQDETTRDAALAKLPSQLKTSAGVTIPFYRHIVDSLDAIFDTKNIDLHAVRELRALVEKNYTPQELEDMDRNLWERFRKAALSGDKLDPNKFTQVQLDLTDDESRIGEIGSSGQVYTLQQFGNDIANASKPLPPETLTEEYGFSPLVEFYQECSARWEEYYKLPTQPPEIRQDWRKSHTEEEAMMLFWGKTSQSIFTSADPKWQEIANLLRMWFSIYNIGQGQHPEWADWMTGKAKAVE